MKPSCCYPTPSELNLQEDGEMKLIYAAAVLAILFASTGAAAIGSIIPPPALRWPSVQARRAESRAKARPSTSR